MKKIIFMLLVSWGTFGQAHAQCNPPTPYNGLPFYNSITNVSFFTWSIVSNANSYVFELIESGGNWSNPLFTSTVTGKRV